MLQQTLYLLVGLFAAVTVLIALMRVRRWCRRRTAVDDDLRCKCGYLLKGLSLPRCPECGRAIGFDKTFEELGIAKDELRSREPPPPPV